ncbi:hypothetical protein GCM10023221_20860 [Luteimicrobium xylanilyticum]
MVAAVVGLMRTTWQTLAARARRRDRAVAGVAAAVLVAGVLAAALATHDTPARPMTAAVPSSSDARAPQAHTSAPDRNGGTEGRPARPARPAALERSDERGASAAAVYVLELEPYGLLSGDWHDFAALCSTESGWCQDKAASMRLVEAGVVRYVGCAMRAEAVRTTPTDAPDTFVVTVAQRQEACVRHEAASTDPPTRGDPSAAPAAGDGVDVYSGNDDPDSLPDLLDITVRHGGEGWQVVRASLA